MVKGRLSIKMKKKELTVSEQMQDELEPIMHPHPTEHDESDDLEMVKDTHILISCTSLSK
jgi:hypothetical protein